MAKGRYEDARKVLIMLHGTEGPSFIEQELIQIRQQFELEAAAEHATWSYSLKQLFSRRMLRRTLMATFIVSQAQLSGASIIQNFQNAFYAIVGITGRQSLLVSGLYGFMGVLGTIIYLYIVADKWPRVRTLWSGSVVLCVFLSIIMALSARFGDRTVGGNAAGAKASIAFIFVYSAAFAIFFNSMIWVVPSELFPMFLRSKGMAVAVSTKSIIAIILSQVTPLALQNVSWRFYSLFIACNATAAGIYFFLLPETGGKSLEEIAELFGDTLATDELGQIDVSAKRATEHLEAAVETNSTHVEEGQASQAQTPGKSSAQTRN